MMWPSAPAHTCPPHASARSTTPPTPRPKPTRRRPRRTPSCENRRPGTRHPNRSPRPPRAGKACPIPFGGPPSPVRLFGVGLGDQAGWMLPFALFGLLGLALLVLLDRRPAAADGRAPRRRPPGVATRGWRRRSCLAAGFWWRPRCSACPRESSIPTTSQRSRPGRRRWPARARLPSSRWHGDSGRSLSLAADGLRGAGDGAHPGGADAPRALHAVVHPGAGGRSRRRDRCVHRARAGSPLLRSPSPSCCCS